jgi:hypothetical protein
MRVSLCQKRMKMLHISDSSVKYTYDHCSRLIKPKGPCRKYSGQCSHLDSKPASPYVIDDIQNCDGQVFQDFLYFHYTSYFTRITDSD